MLKTTYSKFEVTNGTGVMRNSLEENSIRIIILKNDGTLIIDEIDLDSIRWSETYSYSPECETGDYELYLDMYNSYIKAINA